MKQFMWGLLGCALCWGQATDDCRPSSLNIPACVHADRGVTFRVSAPDAQKVQVRLGGAHDIRSVAAFPDQRRVYHRIRYLSGECIYRNREVSLDLAQNGVCLRAMQLLPR